jgi:hypothetical protein
MVMSTTSTSRTAMQAIIHGDWVSSHDRLGRNR